MDSVVQGLSGITNPVVTPNPLGAITGATPATGATAATATASPLNPFQKFLNNGIPMPKFVLFLLTIFPPTGIIGLNLSAINNVVGTIMKALSYGIGILWGMYFYRLYPSTISKVISILMFIGPWYLFDIISILDNPFIGFRSPIIIPGYPEISEYKDIANPDGTWTLSPTLLGIIMTTIPAGIAGGTGIASYFSPSSVSDDTKKYINYTTIGMGALIGGIGLYSMFQTPATAAAAAPLVQGGGGRSRVPSLSEIAKDLARPIDARNNAESQSFLGILAIVFLGGLAIAVTRSKQAAKTTS